MSTLLEQASLVMIPSGYKEDVVYSQIPTSGAGDLTFTRASNGTRINSAGLVEDCPWNLLGYSEDFTNAYWPKSDATITSNAIAAPNGTTTADKLIATATNANHLINKAGAIPVISGQSYTFSLYAKAAEYTFVRVQFQAVNFPESWANFNLSNGTIGLTTGVSGTIESVGNGWYRCSITQTATGTGNSGLQPFVLDSNRGSSSPSYTGDGTSGIYIWGTQFNFGSTAKPYFPTTDRLNVPRLTYQNGGGGCPSLLLEKQSTNVLTYSEDFTNAAWTKINSGSGSTTPVVTANYATSPDGTQNADRLQCTLGSSGYSLIQQEIIAGGTHTGSIWVKSNTGANQNIYFRVSTNTTAYVVTPEWQRITLTESAGDYLTIGLRDQTGYTNYSCDILIWGAQLEASSYPTSYIVTTSSSATRVADACFKTGIGSLIGSTSGAMFMDINNPNPSQYLGTPPANTIFGSINSGDYQNNFHFTTYDVNIYLYCNASGGALQAAIGTTMPTTSKIKMAVTYTNSAIKFFLNGVLVGTDTSFTLPSSMSRVDIGHMGGQPDSQRMRGSVNEFLLFTTALTDAEAIALTTL